MLRVVVMIEVIKGRREAVFLAAMLFVFVLFRYLQIKLLTEKED